MHSLKDVFNPLPSNTAHSYCLYITNLRNTYISKTVGCWPSTLAVNNNNNNIGCIIMVLVIFLSALTLSNCITQEPDTLLSKYSFCNMTFLAHVYLEVLMFLQKLINNRQLMASLQILQLPLFNSGTIIQFCLLHLKGRAQNLCLQNF